MAEEADRARASVVSTPSAEMNLNNLMNLLLMFRPFYFFAWSGYIYFESTVRLSDFSYSLSIPSLFGIRGQNVILIDVRNT
jgi:hypothetical protein